MTQDEIVKKYKYMFNHMSDSRYPISYGFSCDDGWNKILENLITKISEIDIYKVVRIFQIKEKFGTLRFYIEFTEPQLPYNNIIIDYSDDIYKLITETEKLSAITCERCGKTPAKVTGKGWIKTLCDECVKNESR